jgi:hypothetical protein
MRWPFRLTLTEMVSFSLTMGTTPILSNSLKVLTAFKYRVRYRHGMSAAFVVPRIPRHTSEMSPRVRSTCAIGCSSCPNRLSQSAINRPWPIAAKAYSQNPSQIPRNVGGNGSLPCFPDKLFGLLARSMRLRPTPIAPELTSTTLWPWVRRCTTDSTMAERVDKSGWWVFSWTMDDVPIVKIL